MRYFFILLDANRDGIIDVDDLSKTFNTLGISKAEQDLQSMVDEAMGPMNFSIFLNMLAERMGGVDPEDTLQDSCKKFTLILIFRLLVCPNS